MIRVSILIPVYNGELYLAEAVESVLTQKSAPEFEVVVVNDGSTDRTPVILRDFARRTPRMRILDFDHSGIAHALAAGLSACRGEYVCRLDSDDRMLPDRLAAQCGFLDLHPEITLISGRVLHEPHPEVPSMGMQTYVDWMNRQKTHAEMQAAIWTDSPLAHPSVTFRKTAVSAVGGYREVPWPEDTDLWFRLLHAGHRFAKLEQDVLVWRDHTNRLTRTDDGRYGSIAQTGLKAHFLPLFFPGITQNGVTLIGAGPFGKRLAKALIGKEIRINRFVDIDPRKIGSTRLGIPVVGKDRLNCADQDLLVVAVGTPGSRQEIHDALVDIGILCGTHAAQENRVVFCH